MTTIKHKYDMRNWGNDWLPSELPTEDQVNEMLFNTGTKLETIKQKADQDSYLAWLKKHGKTAP